MAKFVKGDVVVIPFPFSDLSQSKRRPALVLAVLQGDDLILCQISRKNIKDNYAIRINEQWRVCFEWYDGNAYRMEVMYLRQSRRLESPRAPQRS
jgi:hypothetical protein